MDEASANKCIPLCTMYVDRAQYVEMCSAATKLPHIDLVQCWIDRLARFNLHNVQIKSEQLIDHTYVLSLHISDWCLSAHIDSLCKHVQICNFLGK